MRFRGAHAVLLAPCLLLVRERTDRLDVPTIKKLPFAGITEERRESLTEPTFRELFGHSESCLPFTEQQAALSDRDGDLIDIPNSDVERQLPVEADVLVSPVSPLEDCQELISYCFELKLHP